MGVPQHQRALAEREREPVPVQEGPEVLEEQEEQEGQVDAAPWVLVAQKEQQVLPERPEPQPLQVLPEPSRQVSKRYER